MNSERVWRIITEDLGLSHGCSSKILAHRFLSIREFLAKNNIAMVDQPPYSSDLDPVTFFSSPNSRGVLKGTHFKDSTTIKRVETKEFRAIPEESSQE